MRENKSKYLILGIIVGLLLLISLLVLVISNNEQNNISRDIKKLENNSFFLIQNIVNNYYYSDNNDLNNQSFVANNIYFNDDKRINYYFINGYYISRSFDGEITYNDNVNFLVIVKNGNYNIQKIDNILNLEEFAKNYEINNIDVSDNILPSYNLSVENKLTYYLATFIDLVEADPEKAYNMLDENLLKKYSNYNTFYNDRLEVLNNISTYVNGYEEIGEKKYIVVDKKFRKITITEESPMHFKIDF